MAFTLPRLNRVVDIVGNNKPTLSFHRWWDSVASAIEQQVIDILALIDRVSTTETDISAAQVDITTLSGSVTDEATARAAADTALDLRLDTLEAFNLTSGTYTPTLTNTTNIDASTAYACQYLRVGNTVTVSGRVEVDATVGTTSTDLGMSLPIASNFTAAEQLGGTGVVPSLASTCAAIFADTTNDRATLRFVSTDTANRGFWFTFTYRVL